MTTKDNWIERLKKEFYEGLYSANESDGEMSDRYDEVKDFISKEIDLALSSKLSEAREEVIMEVSKLWSKSKSPDDFHEKLRQLFIEAEDNLQSLNKEERE